MKKQKNIFIIAGIIIASVLGILAVSQPSVKEYINANILTSFNYLANEDVQTIALLPEGLDILDIMEGERITGEAPLSPDLLNSFNLFADIKTEESLGLWNAEYVKTNYPEITSAFTEEIISYVDRAHKNAEINDDALYLIPMWPEYNVSTYGNVLAYLFPLKEDPLGFAKSIKIVPNSSSYKNGRWMTRLEFIRLIDHIFIPGNDVNPHELLEENNIISSADKWKDDTTDGFLVVESVRVILNLREYIERRNILRSKKKYEKGLVDIQGTTAKVNSGTIEIVLKAVQDEYNHLSRSNDVLDQGILADIRIQFKDLYDEDLPTETVEKIRNAYYLARNLEPPPQYILPVKQDLGACTNELYRKTYFGPFAKTGALGSIFFCGNLKIVFPANSYLINLFSFPRITALANDDYPDKIMFRTDVLRSLKNTLIIGPEGEKLLEVVYEPDNISEFLGKVAGVYIATQGNSEIVNIVDVYTRQGFNMYFHLRKLGGDNLVYIDPKMDDPK